jgi:hypothetical protein
VRPMRKGEREIRDQAEILAIMEGNLSAFGRIWIASGVSWRKSGGRRK